MTVHFDLTLRINTVYHFFIFYQIIMFDEMSRTYKECLAVMFYLIKWIYLLSYSIKHKLCLMGHKLIYTYHLTNLTSCHTLALNSNSFQGFRVIQKCCSKSSFYTSIKHNVFHFKYLNMVNKTHESTIKN